MKELLEADERTKEYQTKSRYPLYARSFETI